MLPVPRLLLAALVVVLFLASATHRAAAADDVLDNAFVRASFDDHGLTRLTDERS